MLTVNDFTAQYETLSNSELYQMHLNAADYSDAAKEALAVVILQRGGVENLRKETEHQNFQLQEEQRIAWETRRLAQGGTSVDFLKKVITSSHLPQEDVAAIIERTYKEVDLDYADKQVKPRTIMGSVVGGAIASVVGGGLWGLLLVQTHRIIYFFIAGLALLSYGLIKLFTKQSKENVVVLVATILSVAGALLIGQIIFDQFG